MKSIFFLYFLSAVLIAHNAFGQNEAPVNLIRCSTSVNIERCGTAAYYQCLLSTHPEFKKQFGENQKKIRNAFPSAARMTAVSDTIPVVIHVVAPAAIQQLVTDAVIQSQIDVLNEDYRGKNADSVRIPAAFKPLHGKSGMVFKLAGTSLIGEPTQGIVRITTNQTYSFSTFENVKFSSFGGSDAWDPNLYLNIWVVSFGSTSILGQSVFPGDPRPLAYHGFVCDYRAFGRGAAHLNPKYNKGRTTTHELGHFFDLEHIWADDDGACTGTDFPADAANDDTPNQANATFGNPDPSGTGVVKTDSCSPSPPGIMYQNYMDYTDDVAMVLFTKGQLKRIQNTFTNAPDRSPLLYSTTYKAAPVFINDARIRRITAPVSPLCQVLFSPEVVLRNSGSVTLTSIKIVSILNGKAPVLFNWTGALTPYTETKVVLSGLTAQAGMNTLKIYADLPNAATDENPANDTATLSFEVTGTIPLTTRFDEGFTAGQFPPAGWKVINPDNDLTWQRISYIGKDKPGCAWFNDWNNQALGRYDELVTPPFSYSNSDSVYLYFNLAAASGHSTSTTDTLSVLISGDCGQTFTTIYRKWGTGLQTLKDPSVPVNTSFFPMDDEWRKDSVNLETVLGPSANTFQLYFRFSGNKENNIFLDDISLVVQTVPRRLKEEGYLVAPTLFRSRFAIRHYLTPADLRNITIHNSSGQLIWSRAFSGTAQTFIDVDLPGQPAGVYFVQLFYRDSRRNIIQRVVKY